LNRFYKESNGSVNAVPSPQLVMSCTNGCEGGSFDMVYEAMLKYNITSSTVKEYTQKKSQCDASGDSMFYKTKEFAGAEAQGSSIKSVLGVQEMMYEVWKNGPGGVYVKVADLFQSYGGSLDNPSVLRDTTCNQGMDGKCVYSSADTNHACTLIGWGVDAGIPYWLV
jgi:hypothetical protein